MYRASFLTLNAKVPFGTMLILSLKRSFISVFLPAGGVAQYAFFTGEVEKHGVSKTKTHLASVVYGISGFASLFLIGIPAIFLLAFSHHLSQNIFLAFILLLIIIITLFFAFRSLVRQKWVFKTIVNYFPSVALVFEELENEHYSNKYFITAIFYSFLIELCGIAHLYIISHALGIQLNISVVLIAYVVATLTYALSPFMRGIGAVELTLSLTLIQYGIPQIIAISCSLLYRFFEFWIPLLIGAGSFIYKKDNLLLRILPPFLTLALGLVDIFSVLTPPIRERAIFLREFLPKAVLHFSSFTTIVAGIVLVVLSAYLIRGMRNAWLATIAITVLSIVANLVKAFDYEEAVFALIVLSLLIYTKDNYIVRRDKRLFNNTKWFYIGAFFFIFIYGTVGFYFLEVRHFGVDLNWGQSFVYMLNSLLVFNNDLLPPQTHFAGWFLQSLNFLGAALVFYSLFILLKPRKHHYNPLEPEICRANELVKLYGRSSLDYFKTYPDKLFYFTKDRNAFIAFKLAGDYAVVLETPVCENDSLIPSIIIDFEEYCNNNGLRSIYYRVDEDHLKYFNKLKKKSIFIGQEGIVDLSNFSLEGGEKKPTRNALNKAKSIGYTCNIYNPPQKDGFLQKLKSVSDEWLLGYDKKESAFTQGVWNVKELKHQVIFAVEDEEEKVVAFANIIPDYAKDECTYDLIRKTNDASGGVLDVIMVNMIEYFKGQNKLHLNLGMAPFSGIDQAKNFKERTIKFAYQNFKQFDHFKGLRFFKEKYAYLWKNKYLVYANDFDLLQIPSILEKVSKYETN
jgi:phosphatidylglycerol lysyltransferase